jgi:hypothetical protein
VHPAVIASNVTIEPLWGCFNPIPGAVAFKAPVAQAPRLQPQIFNRENTMATTFRRLRLALTSLLLTLGIGACAAHETAYRPPYVPAALVHLEIYDRNNGSALPVHTKDGRRYIVGTPGHEYALRIRNRTGARVLVVTSVDGVNVISGDTAAPSQSGYVLDPYGSVEVIGWRKSLERTAAFFFTEHQNSYAARTGRPDDVGVIGVAVFREKVQPIARSDRMYRPSQAAPEGEARPSLGIRGLEDSAGAPAAAPRESAAPESMARHESMNARPAPQAKLGTGHGREEASRVRMVAFERATAAPSETVAIQYDRRENLVAMGVLPSTPRYTRREPQPFPGEMRFAPDPAR